MNPPRIPRATYRLQLGRDFGFAQAAALVPYLRALGVSHVYCSPYLKARAGSQHGYDIVDHNALNPELGSRADFEMFTAALRGHGMGQILDLVPNHMGVGGDDNPWWLDVLENGPASAYADYFDIDWQPAKPELAARLLLPLLEDHYGKVLEAGLLRLRFDSTRGEFSVAYREHRFPVDPRTAPLVLRMTLEALTRDLGPGHAASIQCLERIGEFEALPPRWQTADEPKLARQRDKETAKQHLASSCAAHPALRRGIEDQVAFINGRGGDPGGIEKLHELLEQQTYRLAYWRVAADEINYRRFFDINTLAGLRMERPEVFEATHRLVLALIRDGRLHGLRIDHPDGLYDPARYYERLRTATAAAAPDPAPLYTVAEKILGRDEALPSDWQVHGTSGYEFATLAGGLFIHPDGERPLTRLVRRFTGELRPFDELVYECKRLVMRTLLAGELQVLANLLDRFSESDRNTRDHTLATLRDALMEFVACLPVYRTYITDAGASDQDRRCIREALAAARRRRPTPDPTVFDFLEQVFDRACDGRPPEVVQFVMKLQQYSAPVMAKGLEDTALYAYPRLVSLNEVGGDPRRFGTTLEEFHDANRERARQCPHNLLATSTHDTKRSEDVRARLHVLSEFPELWQQRVNRWSRQLRRRKRELDGRLAPSRNDEYLLYQTLLGAWPPAVAEAGVAPDFSGRIEAYMLKAAREAKQHTSWLNPNPAYEAALTGFVRGALASRRFLADFLPFQKRIARYGLLNSLSQTLIKLTAPGVPDLYQGCELWDFSLVDPDNRRPVDFAHRQSQLQALIEAERGAPRTALLHSLLAGLEDGRAKLLVTAAALAFRADDPQLFRDGDYRPLDVRGPKARCLCAYVRTLGERKAIALAPRWYSRLLSDTDDPWPAPAAWQDTRIELPGDAVRYLDVISGERLTAQREDDRCWLTASEALKRFPVTLLRAVSGDEMR